MTLAFTPFTLAFNIALIKMAFSFELPLGNRELSTHLQI